MQTPTQRYDARPRDWGESGAGMATPSRVTVVVPCYAHAHFLAECLRSLCAQRETAWEAVVVDDGSPDGEEIEKVVAKLGDERVRILAHGENRGRAAARNTGLREARTEYVLCLDADDRLAPHALECLLAALDADATLDGAHTDVRLFACAGEVVPYPGPAEGSPPLRAGDAPPCAGTLLRRSLWERAGEFDEAGELRERREEQEWWIRAFERGCRVARLPADEVAPAYERRVVHASEADRPGDDRAAAYVYEKHRSAFDASGESKAFLADGLRRAARAEAVRGRRGSAFGLRLRAWRLMPSVAELKASLRGLLSPATNDAIDEGVLRRALPLAGYPLCHGADRHRPFFIVGMGRSGNTLLRRLLTAHSELHVPPETYVLRQAIRAYEQQRGRLGWSELVGLVLARFAFHPEFHHFDMDLGPVYERLVRLPGRERSLAAVLDGVFRHHAETQGKFGARWGDKSPVNSYDDALARGQTPRALGRGLPPTLERLRHVFPDAQFLHIYRDGCDVVHSCLRAGHYRDVQSAGRAWLHVESQARRFTRLHADRSHDVRYEDLVARPEEVVREICEFLDVEFEPAMLSSEGAAGTMGDVPAQFWHHEVTRPITTRNVGRSRRLLSLEQRRELQALIGPMLAGLGYEPALANS